MPWKELRQSLENSAPPICVTFNSSSAPQSEKKDYPEAGLVLRVLWAGLFEVTSAPAQLWGEFVRKTIKRYSLTYTLERALLFIMKVYETKSVLLCLDELVKAPCPERVAGYLEPIEQFREFLCRDLYP